jgi:hypothetical protein
MRDVAAFLMRSLWIAVLAAAFFGVLALRMPPFAILSGAVVALAALSRGGSTGLIVAAGAGLLVGGAWLLLPERPGLAFPLVYAVWPPLLVAAELLRRNGSLGRALLAVGLTVAGYDLAMHLAVGDVVSFWHEWLKHAVAAVPGASIEGFAKNGSIRLMNGFLGVLYGLSLMTALLFGRWLHSLLDHPGDFAPEFRRLRLPRLVLPVWVAVVWAAGWWNPVLLADFFMAGMLMYFFVGLAVIHGVIAARGMPIAWVVPIYLGLAFFPEGVLVALALAGAVDTFVDFRDQKSPEE